MISYCCAQVGHSQEAAVRSRQALRAVLLLRPLQGAERSAR